MQHMEIYTVQTQLGSIGFLVRIVDFIGRA